MTATFIVLEGLLFIQMVLLLSVLIQKRPRVIEEPHLEELVKENTQHLEGITKSIEGITESVEGMNKAWEEQVSGFINKEEHRDLR